MKTTITRLFALLFLLSFALTGCPGEENNAEDADSGKTKVENTDSNTQDGHSHGGNDHGHSHDGHDHGHSHDGHGHDHDHDHSQEEFTVDSTGN